MTDPTTRDLARIASKLKRGDYVAARAAAEALAPGPAVHELDRCSVAVGDLTCDLPPGHTEQTGLDHYDTRQRRFFRVLPSI